MGWEVCQRYIHANFAIKIIADAWERAFESTIEAQVPTNRLKR